MQNVDFRVLLKPQLLRGSAGDMTSVSSIVGPALFSTNWEFGQKANQILAVAWLHMKSMERCD